MAQFDVYKNPSSHSNSVYPYLLDIQHDFLTDLATRIRAGRRMARQSLSV